MNRILAAVLLALLTFPASAQTGPVGGPIPAGANNIGGVALNPIASMLQSTLTMPAATTAYTAGWMAANTVTGTSVVVPSLTLATAGQNVGIAWLRLSSNDTTATGWPGQTMQVDFWNTAPTFAVGHGDRAAFLAATGAGAHLATFTCTMSAMQGDGTYAECSPSLGTMPMISAAPGSTALYWTLTANSGSGITGASGVWTLSAKVLN